MCALPPQIRFYGTVCDMLPPLIERRLAALEAAQDTLEGEKA